MLRATPLFFLLAAACENTPSEPSIDATPADGVAAPALDAALDGPPDATAPPPTDATSPPPIDAGVEPDAGPDAAPDVPGPNTPEHIESIVNAWEADEVDRGTYRARIRGVEEAAPPALDGDVEVTTLLQARPAPYMIEGTVRVAAGAILVIEEGAVLRFAEGATLQVDGRLYAAGGPRTPVTFEAAGAAPFNTIALAGGPNRLAKIEIRGGDRLLAVTHPPETRTRIENARLDGWVDVALDLSRTANVTLRDSEAGFHPVGDGASGEVGGETIRARRSGYVRIEGNHFAPRVGYRDAIDLQDCVGDEWPIVAGNTFEGGEDDAVDLDRCSTIVVGNLMHNFRPSDLNVRRAGTNGGGVTGDGDTDALIVNNVIVGCFHGIGFKNGARPVMVNNTLVGNHIGVTLYQSQEGMPSPHGVMINNVLADNVDWLSGEPQDVLLNGRWWPLYNHADEVQATLDARFNTFASGGEAPPGEGNSTADPRVALRDGLPYLEPGSPAIDSGLGVGLDTVGADPAALLDALQTDFLGQPRAFVNGELPGIDRGAIESR